MITRNSSMKEIREIIELVGKTASLKEKERILNEHKDNMQLFELLRLHLNPYDQFYIAKMPTETIPGIEHWVPEGKDHYHQFCNLVRELKTRSITGHIAQKSVYEFFKKCDADERWVFETVLLKKAMNFGTSLVNKVMVTKTGKFIPEFDCMLADADQPKLSEVTYPVVAQLKLDGFRAVYFPDSKTFIGRNGKAIRNQNLQNYFAKLSKNQTYVLDGELYSDTLNFNQISSVLNSEDKPLDGIYYCVYDCVPKYNWIEQTYDVPYRNRWELLETLSKLWNMDNVKVITGITANNEQEVAEFYKDALNKGYEGLMLKGINGTYQWKRVSVKSQIMMKLKPSDEYDGKIIGTEEGEGKIVGQLGKLIVRVDGIKNEVGVGTGFSEEQRKEFWKNRNQLVGEWIRMKAFEVTEGKESLRFPVFLAIRDSKD